MPLVGTRCVRNVTVLHGSENNKRAVQKFFTDIFTVNDSIIIVVLVLV